MGQQLGDARDMLRAARLVAAGFGFASKPFYVLNDEFIRAAMVIKSKA